MSPLNSVVADGKYVDSCSQHTGSHAKTHHLNALFFGASIMRGNPSDSYPVVYLHYPLLHATHTVAIPLRLYHDILETQVDDPDAPPPKILTLLDKLGPVELVVVGFGLSLLQPRFMLLFFAGAALITEARLSTKRKQ